MLTGAIYGFLSPGFGFNTASLYLLLAMTIGIASVTYVSEGGAAWFSQRHLKVPAGVRVHTGAVLVALVCVVISRLIDFKPGIVYGFIASTVLLVPIALDRNQSGRMAMYPMLMLLGTAMTAWLLLGWVRGDGGGGGWANQLAQALLAGIFVGGIEGVMYNLVPIAFLDGRAIFEWKKPAWIAMFGVSTFLFWQLLINPDGSYFDFRETGVTLVLVVAAVYALVTAATWSYFRWRNADTGDHEAECLSP